MIIDVQECDGGVIIMEISRSSFRLLLGGESAIIRPVSRKAILGICFDMCMLDEIRAKRDEIYAIARAHKAEKLWVFDLCTRKAVIWV